MNVRVVLAACCSLVAYAPSVLAEDSAGEADASSEEASSELDPAAVGSEDDGNTAENEGDAAEDWRAAPRRGLKWSWFSAGLSGRYGSMSGASGPWADLILAVRTSTDSSVGFRFELGGGYGHISNETDIPMTLTTDQRAVNNNESMDIFSGLFRIQLEIPEDPLRIRIGPAIGMGTGEYHSDTSTCGNEVWNRVIGGGGVDVSLGIDNPVLLEPFVRFDVIYLGIPQCVQGDRLTDTSTTLEEPRVTTSEDLGLFVGLGLLLGL